MAKKAAAVKERPVLVTTAHRGVFFGYLISRDGDTLKLRAARNCIYWPATVKGFAGLAHVGPLDGSRVGHPADMELFGVTAILDVTKEAVERWEAGPWK